MDLLKAWLFFMLVIWFLSFCSSYGRSVRQAEKARERELAEAMLIRGVANAQPDRADPVQLAKAEIVLLKAKQ